MKIKARKKCIKGEKEEEKSFCETHYCIKQYK
jgi:hypothetical protein